MATVAGSLRNKVLVLDDVTTGDLTVTGSVTISGTATTLNSTNTSINDHLIELNAGLTGSNPNDTGLILERGTTGNNVFIGWDESADKVVAGLTTSDGTATGNLTLTYANFQAASATFTGTVTTTGVDSSGLIDTEDNVRAGGMIRATGWWESGNNSGNTSGMALEIGVSGTTPHILAYDRTNTSYGNMTFGANTYTFNSATNTNFASGKISVGGTEVISSSRQATFDHLALGGATGDNGEDIKLGGIRGRYTNEHIQMYQKVGIGYPSGWDGDNSNTPSYGLATYGGAALAYNQGGVSIGETIGNMDTTNLKLQVNGHASIKGANALYFGITTNNYNSWKGKIWNNNTSTMYINAQALNFNNSGYGSSTFFLSNSTGFDIRTGGLLINQSTLSDASKNLTTGTINSGNITAPIMYDSGSSSRYVDPASTSVLENLTINGTLNADGSVADVTDRNFVEIYVYGSSDTTYYPVVITSSGEHYAYQDYSVSRRYNWTAPASWNTSTHQGALTLTWQHSGDTAWGGNDKDWRVIQFDEVYANLCNGLSLSTTGGMVVWLRGGGSTGARYRIQTPRGSAAPINIYDGTTSSVSGGGTHQSSTTFTSGSGTAYQAESYSSSNVTSRLMNNWPVRDKNKLYDNGNRVIDQGSTTHTKSGILQSSSSVRAPIFYDTSGTTYYLDLSNTGTALYVPGNISSRNVTINASGTSDTSLEIGASTSSNHYAYIDLVGDSTYSDYGLRIIRNNGGANTTSDIYHRGTGNFNITTMDAANLRFNTSGSNALTIEPSGRVSTFTSSVGGLKIGPAVNHTDTTNARITSSSGTLYIDSAISKHLYLGWYSSSAYDVISEMSARFPRYRDRNDTQYLLDPADTGTSLNVAGSISTGSHGTSANWKQAYDNYITAVSVSGSSTKTITLTQRDGGTLTANWTDLTSDTNNYVDSISFSAGSGQAPSGTAGTDGTGVLTLGRSGSLSDLTVDLDNRYLQRQYMSNWTRVGYGNSGTTLWHKLCTITINGSYKDYSAAFYWTDRYDRGEASIHIHSDNDNTADVWAARFVSTTNSNRKSASDVMYTQSGSTVEIFVKTPGWRQFAYIRNDAVTEGTPQITWYDESSTTEYSSQPSNTTAFTDMTPISQNGYNNSFNGNLSDRDDSNYYLNPAGTSILYNVSIERGNSGDDAFIELKNTGYTGNITSLRQNADSTRAELNSTERSILIQAGSGGGSTGAEVRLYANQTEGLRVVNGGHVYTYNNTYLGNSNGDQTHINDTLYLGATDSGDSHFYFGENSSNWYGDHWYWDSGYEVERYSRFAGTDSLIEKHDTRYTHKVQTARAYERTSVTSGYQIGSYNSNGANEAKTNPIYTIGDSYRPTDTSLSNMYGIGFTTRSSTNFLSGFSTSGWGQYVAQGGTARIWLDATAGNVESTGSLRSPIFEDKDNTGYYVSPASSSKMVYLGLATDPETSGSYRLKMGGNIHMNNNHIHYVHQLHFNNGTRFETDSSTVTSLWADSASAVQLNLGTGAQERNGALYADSSNNVGLLDSDNHWALRHSANSFTQFSVNNVAKATVDNEGIKFEGDLGNTHQRALRGQANLAGANLLTAATDIARRYGGGSQREFRTFVDGNKVACHYSQGVNNSATCYQWISTEWVDVDPEKDYEYTLWIQADGDHNIYMGWHEQNASGTIISSNPYMHTSTVDTNGGWVKLTARLKGHRTPSPNGDSEGTDRFANDHSYLDGGTGVGGSDGVMHSTTRRIMMRFGTCYGTANTAKTYFYLPSIREISYENAQHGFILPNVQNSAVQAGQLHLGVTSWSGYSGIEYRDGSGSQEFRMSSTSGDLNLRVDGTGQFHGSGGVEADVFKDINNAGYFIKPADDSNLNHLNINGLGRVISGSIGLNDSTTTKGLAFDGNYTNGQYRHRMRKQDLGGGVPLYIDYAAGTANSYTNIVRFGPYSNNTQNFEVFGGARVTGNLELGIGSTTQNGYLMLHGSTANKTAELFCSNGNLHIDSDSGNGIYMNWYGGTTGTYFGNGAAGQVGHISGSGFATFAGHVTAAGALKVTESGTAQVIMIGNQDSGGVNKPAMIMGVNGYLRFGHGSSWSSEGGTFTEHVSLQSGNFDLSGNAYIGGGLRVEGASDPGGPGLRFIGTHGTSYAWIIKDSGNFVYGRAHDWSQSFQLDLSSGTTGAGTAWASFGQKNSNSTNGTWRGIDVRKYASGNVAGDVRAGNYYLNGTGKYYSDSTTYYLDPGNQSVFTNGTNSSESARDGLKWHHGQGPDMIIWGHGDATGSGNIKIYSDSDGTIAAGDKFIFEHEGNFYAHGDVTAYSSSTASDIRLKENIRDLEGSLDKTLKLRGVKFDWKDEHRDKDNLGFIAQEVEKIVPEVVKEVVNTNDDDMGTHKVVQYASLVPMLVEAIKELKDEIDDLRDQLNKKEL